MLEGDGPINLDIGNIDAMKEIERTLKQNQVKGTLYHFYCWRDLCDFEVKKKNFKNNRHAIKKLAIL